MVYSIESQKMANILAWTTITVMPGWRNLIVMENVCYGFLGELIDNTDKPIEEYFKK